MIIKKINLKDKFSFIGKEGANPYLDVYLPDDSLNRADFKRPCLLICPGGGYGFCTPREGEPIALNFIPEGFNTFVLYYTCAPSRFPTQITEVAAAMELIYINAHEWHCDTEKITIIGFSAGGHLATHYSTSFDCEEIREKFPKSKAPNGSILCYPVISSEQGKCHSGTFKNLIGHYPLSQEETQKFSLENCVSDNTPPAFIWHTVEDNTVPVYSSLAYANALAEHKIPFELRIFPKGGHGLSTCDMQTIDKDADCLMYNHRWISEAKIWLKFMNLA